MKLEDQLSTPDDQLKSISNAYNCTCSMKLQLTVGNTRKVYFTTILLNVSETTVQEDYPSTMKV